MTDGEQHWEIPVPFVVRKRGQHGPPRLPLTANDRLHWAPKAALVAQIRQNVGWQARSMRIPPQAHIRVGLHYAPGDHRVRDPSNLMPTQKAALDGLVDAGVVPADDPRWVTERIPLIRHPGPTYFERHLILVVDSVRPCPLAGCGIEEIHGHEGYGLRFCAQHDGREPGNACGCPGSGTLAHVRGCRLHPDAR